MPSRLIVILVSSNTILHLVFLSLFFEPAYSSPDAHGYFLQGKLIAETGNSELKVESPVQQVGQGNQLSLCSKVFTTIKVAPNA